MERRSYATFKKHWADKKLIVTSPQVSFEEYPTEEIPLERVINIMVGDLQRIKFYPEKGFQIFQEIPADVWLAYEQLIACGFQQTPDAGIKNKTCNSIKELLYNYLTVFCLINA
jgi:hypothetical protein